MATSEKPKKTFTLPQALSTDAGYLAVRLGQISQRNFEKVMTEIDLRPPMFDYLTALDEYGSVSQKELSEILRFDTAKIVALTDELEAKGAITRTADPTDRRRNLIAFTKSGQALLVKAHRIAKKAESEMLNLLNPKEQETLRNLLRKTQGI